MYVKIGPFVDWIGPYQIAAKILFWIPERNEDWSYNETVWNFGKWLAEDKNGESSRLAKFCEWVHSKKKRKVKIKIHSYDSWNADGTLAMVILPVLKQLQKDKHGSGYVDHEDVPEHLHGAPGTEENNYTDPTIHERWDWVLNEMIWAFEQSQPDCDWEEQFRKGEIDFKFVDSEETDANGKALFATMERGPNHTYECDYEGMEEYQKRIDNGTRLFGKYYRSLWD